MTSSSSSSPEISGAGSQDRFSYKHATHDEVLEDLSSRFILNLPDDELSSLERICFQVEQAHWFYEDFIREENPKFPSLPLKKFSAMLFHACPLLHQWSHDHEQAFTTFMQYKTRVPVCGAIMLNDTWEKCVLVKGWKSSSGWGFPKGKINEVEPPANCAIREVLEETGYNLAGQLNPDNVIEMSIKEQKISLFIVPGVPEDYPFKTKTRKEISKIEWFRLSDLPTWKRNKTAAGRFYLISPFIGALKAFINANKPRGPRKALRTKKNTASQQRKEPSYALYNDSRHESSSQSSSAENGEPQTPSPHYTESHANPIPQVIDAESPKSDESLVVMDPHFAQLLSALALSASPTIVPPSPTGNDKQSTVPLSITTDQSDHQEPTTPIPNTASSLESHASDSLGRTAQSSYMHQHMHTLPVVAHPQGPYPFNSATLYRPHTTLPRSQPQPDSSVKLNHQQSPPYSTTSSSNTTAVSPVTTLTSSSPIASRRTGSITDISPYLNHATSPTSAARMKQIALLEAVSAESARLMQSYKAAAANGLPANVNDNFKDSATPSLPPTPSAASQFHMNGISYPVTHPFPSGLVPTSPVRSQGYGDQRVLYASGPHFQPNELPPNMVPNSGAPYDPFQVRSRTSLAYHRGGSINPNPSGSASMNQTQLLALMNGSRTTPQVPHASVQPPQSREAPYYMPTQRGVHAAMAPQQGLPSYPLPLPTHSTPRPFTPVSIASAQVSLQGPPPSANNTLLSILNGARGPSRMAAAAPYPPFSARSS